MSLCRLFGAGEERGGGGVGRGSGEEERGGRGGDNSGFTTQMLPHLKNTFDRVYIYLLYQLESSQYQLTYSYHRHTIWISPLRSKLVSVIAHGSYVQSNFWIKCVGLVHTHHLEVEITVAGTNSYRGVCMQPEGLNLIFHTTLLKFRCSVVASGTPYRHTPVHTCHIHTYTTFGMGDIRNNW